MTREEYQARMADIAGRMTKGKGRDALITVADLLCDDGDTSLPWDLLNILQRADKLVDNGHSLLINLANSICRQYRQKVEFLFLLNWNLPDVALKELLLLLRDGNKKDQAQSEPRRFYSKKESDGRNPRRTVVLNNILSPEARRRIQPATGNASEQVDTPAKE